jgi:UPF0755 protein
MKPPSLFHFLLVLLSITFCLTLILTAWTIFQYPMQAEKVYGPPEHDLGLINTFYLSFRLVIQETNLTEPFDLQGNEQSFHVKSGESTQVITQHLEDQGFISSGPALRDYLVYSGFDTTLQAGEFILSPRMTPLEIAHALLDATPSEVTFTILPGWRREEIAAALPTSGLGFSPLEFLFATQRIPSSSMLANEIPVNTSLEGFLFPDSYRVLRNISVDNFIEMLMASFRDKVDSGLQSGFNQQGLRLYDAVILASIVQREAMQVDEMPLIASVFLNRFSDGIKLDSDPTVQYALGYNSTQGTWWTNPLSLDNLNFDSPYNTYLYSGLPPGPISNPGIDALQAVAFPTPSSYYYFRAACDGSGRHLFARTLQEHINNACK